MNIRTIQIYRRSLNNQAKTQEEELQKHEEYLKNKLDDTKQYLKELLKEVE